MVQIQTFNVKNHGNIFHFISDFIVEGEHLLLPSYPKPVIIQVCQMLPNAVLICCLCHSIESIQSIVLHSLWDLFFLSSGYFSQSTM